MQNTFQILKSVLIRTVYEETIPYVTVLILFMIVDRRASIYSAATILALFKEIIP
jgi:hypothetical protein